MSEKLRVQNIYKEYEGQPLLRGISFVMSSDETLCLLGRSGSGKSTLMRIIAGIESAERGQLFWEGEEISAVPTHLRRFGLMFQDYALFPHLNVAENIAFGLQMQGISPESIHQRVREALEQVNLDGFDKRNVTELSGGEQQRVALARALAPSPRLLMLDEPLAALDRALRQQLQEELRNLLHLAHIPTIYVTHDQEEALALGDRLALLHEGQIVQMGVPEDVYRFPQNAWVAQFLGMENILPAVVKTASPLVVTSAIGELSAVAGQGNIFNQVSRYRSSFYLPGWISSNPQQRSTSSKVRSANRSSGVNIIRCALKQKPGRSSLSTLLPRLRLVQM
jgi:ABC-type Fe3+/spermidine/putrescine transport system ATPase subunit